MKGITLLTLGVVFISCSLNEGDGEDKNIREDSFLDTRLDSLIKNLDEDSQDLFWLIFDKKYRFAKEGDSYYNKKISDILFRFYNDSLLCNRISEYCCEKSLNSFYYILLEHKPKAFLDSIECSFYNDFGFRDTRRIPLMFPFDITSVDDLRYGRLNYNYASFNESIVSIKSIWFNDQFMAFVASNLDWYDNDKKEILTFGILDFKYEKITYYESLSDLQVIISRVQENPMKTSNLLPLNTFFELYIN